MKQIEKLNNSIAISSVLRNWSGGRANYCFDQLLKYRLTYNNVKANCEFLKTICFRMLIAFIACLVVCLFVWLVGWFFVCLFFKQCW